MRRIVLLFVLIVSTPLFAQPAATGERAALTGEAKIRAICRQLELTPMQTEQLESLLAVFNAEMQQSKENFTETMEQIRVKYRELQEAQKSGDGAAANRIREELKALAPMQKAEAEFWSAFRPTLTEPQLARLETAQRNVEAGVGVSYRAVHVLRVVRTLDLSPEQSRQVETVLAEYRTKVAAQRDESEPARLALVAQLEKDMRGFLTTEEQRVRYDKRLEYYKSLIPPTTIAPTAPPASQPSPPPAPNIKP